MAVIALAAIDLQGAARRAADMLVAEKGGDPSEIVAAFVQRKNGAKALATALAGRKLPADSARLGVRAVRSSALEAPELVEALRTAGGLSQAGPRVLSAEELKQMVADVVRLGDPARGEALYRRKDLTCMKCHAIGGSGGQVGPDLSSVGASAPVDYLIESILQPNKAIKENYHSLVVTTLKGRVFAGIKVRQTKSELILRDKDDKEIGIPLKDIDEQKNGGSLMPEGLADTLTRSELVDLVRFLSELGKVGPFSLSKARLVRTWQALAPTRAAYHLLSRTSFASAASSDATLTWEPAYSTVAGTLPFAALPRFQMSTDAAPIAFVRCQLEATTPGKIVLHVGSPAGLTLWVDRAPVDVTEGIVLDLSAGTHTLTFAIDLAKRKDDLRIEQRDAKGSPARVRIVAGK
jgi:putative heme-binding domain-containing protein